MDVLNFEIINQYKDMLGAEMFLETVDLYEQQTVEYFEKLEDAIGAEDYKQWKDSCHVIKSASGNVGLKAVYTKVAAMEYCEDSFAELADQLQTLKQLNVDGLVEIKKWLTQG